jgi:hypothetical protein
MRFGLIGILCGLLLVSVFLGACSTALSPAYNTVARGIVTYCEEIDENMRTVFRSNVEQSLRDRGSSATATIDCRGSP